jgi:hypothetical protein
VSAALLASTCRWWTPVDNAAEAAILSLVLRTRWRPGSTPASPTPAWRCARCGTTRAQRAGQCAGTAARLWRCNRRLWNDRLGQISLATTTLFWGVSGNLRYIVLAWALLAGLQHHPGLGAGGGGGHWHGGAAVVASMHMR